MTPKNYDENKSDMMRILIEEIPRITTFEGEPNGKPIFRS